MCQGLQFIRFPYYVVVEIEGIKFENSDEILTSGTLLDYTNQKLYIIKPNEYIYIYSLCTDF